MAQYLSIFRFLTPTLPFLAQASPFVPLSSANVNACSPVPSAVLTVFLCSYVNLNRLFSVPFANLTVCSPVSSLFLFCLDLGAFGPLKPLQDREGGDVCKGQNNGGRTTRGKVAK